MFWLHNHHQGAYCCALLKLWLLKKLVKNVVMNQFGRVAAYWCVHSAQCRVRLLLVCAQCTVQSEIVIGVCTVHSAE